jgi:hypothetical protein
MGDSLHELILAAPAPNSGDKLYPDDWKNKTIRIYFQNVNGLRLHDSGSDIIEAFVNLQEI